MARPAEESVVLGLGVAMLANPVYLSALRETTGFGFHNSPILTRVGLAYVGIGVILVVLRNVDSDITVRRAAIAAFGGLALYWAFAATTGHGPFSLSDYFNEVAISSPRVLVAALLFPLGTATNRRQSGAIAGGIAATVLIGFWWIYSTSHGGFSGPGFAVLLTTIYTTAALILGLPLYYVGRRYR